MITFMRMNYHVSDPLTGYPELLASDVPGRMVPDKLPKALRMLTEGRACALFLDLDDGCMWRALPGADSDSNWVLRHYTNPVTDSWDEELSLSPASARHRLRGLLEG